MAIINDRISVTKTPPAPTHDPKNPNASRNSPAPTHMMPNPSATINQSLIDGTSDSNSGFFGSFFSKKKSPGVLQAV